MGDGDGGDGISRKGRGGRKGFHLNVSVMWMLDLEGAGDNLNVVRKKLLVGAVLLLVVLAVGIKYWLQNVAPYGSVAYYGAGQLTNTPGSVWNPLTPIPLSPDKAVLIAI